MNVLFLGFDSISCSHAFRGLPQTLESYNLQDGVSGLPRLPLHWTLHDTQLHGVLMGLTQEQVTVGCAPSWHKPFDKCPLVWKDYSAAHYMTMFLEDGSQTFNWGPESGFNAQSTNF